MTGYGAEIKRIKAYSGTWINGRSVQTFDENRRSIYVSPHEPSFVCWVVAWIDKDGAKLTFTEVTGDPTLGPTYNFKDSSLDCHTKTLVSTDKGESWRDTGWTEKLDNLKFNSDHHWRSVAVRDNGILVRMMPWIPPDLDDPDMKYLVFDPSVAGTQPNPFCHRRDYKDVKSPAAWQSNDGGATWEQVCCLREYDRMKWWPTDMICLRNGRLLAIGSVESENSPCRFRTHFREPAVSMSDDDGRTWTIPQVLDLPADLFCDIDRDSEGTIVQLADNRVLAICRVGSPGGRLQMVLHRANDKWNVESHGTSRLGYGGCPFARMASDGSIFYAGSGGIWATLDEGKDWIFINDFRPYYPQLMEVAPGRIVVAGHQGVGDTCWPPPLEAAIQAATFSYRQVDTFEQTDSSAAPALALLEDSCHADFHARARIRIDERAGLAFRIQDDPRRGYYVAVLRLLDGPSRWAEPKCFDRVKAILDIALIVENRATILNRQYIGAYFHPGAEIELQVRMKGSEIMASVIPDGPEWPRCVFAKDTRLTTGSIGLFTQLASAQFKHVTVWDAARLVRDSWINGGNVSTRGFVPDSKKDLSSIS